MKSTQFKLIILFITSILLSSCASAMKSPDLMALESSGDRMITYNAFLTFEVKDIDSTRLDIINKCKQSNGFITRETNDYLVIRIPVSDFEVFVNKIKENHKLSKSEIRGEDITDSYNDINLQLDSKIKLRDKYTLLLAKAEKVEDMISLEKELERINLEIQRLEGLKLSAETRVKYITINITIKKKITPGPLGWIFYIGYKSIEWLFVWK